ncbi:MAG TPA: (2Fe-2S)-binding protein [Burkholderiales bacterium]|nr:(2Fe-2S)-binding protein [Burkholderiales bacterium]
MDKKRIKVKINGQSYEHEVEPRLLLVDYVRDVVGLKGTHFGCDTTSCGVCTVIVDGRSAKSCTFFAVQADGKEILTIEGLARGGELHPIQEAFWTHHALQCGFCTSGMVMAAYSLLSRNPNPSEIEIKRGIAGNLCRCTGYLPIVEAVKSAAQKLSSRGPAS